MLIIRQESDPFQGEPQGQVQLGYSWYLPSSCCIILTSACSQPCPLLVLVTWWCDPPLHSCHQDQIRIPLYGMSSPVPRLWHDVMLCFVIWQGRSYNLSFNLEGYSRTLRPLKPEKFTGVAGPAPGPPQAFLSTLWVHVCYQSPPHTGPLFLLLPDQHDGIDTMGQWGSPRAVQTAQIDSDPISAQRTGMYTVVYPTWMWVVSDPLS